jgi:predicted MFS family arabinose efflux permease
MLFLGAFVIGSSELLIVGVLNLIAGAGGCGRSSRNTTMSDRWWTLS